MRLSSEVLKGNSLLNQVATQSCVQFGVFPHEPEVSQWARMVKGTNFEYGSDLRSNEHYGRNISYLQVALWCYIYYINTNEMPIHFTLFFPNLAKKFRLALRSCVVFFFVFLIGSLSLTLYTQTSACLFSILFFIHFLWH